MTLIDLHERSDHTADTPNSESLSTSRTHTRQGSIADARSAKSTEISVRRSRTEQRAESNGTSIMSTTPLALARRCQIRSLEGRLDEAFHEQQRDRSGDRDVPVISRDRKRRVGRKSIARRGGGRSVRWLRVRRSNRSAQSAKGHQ